MIGAEEIVWALGKSYDDNDVKRLVSRLGILRSPQLRSEVLDGIERDISSPQDWLVNKALGVELGFELTDAFDGQTYIDWRHKPFTLSQIYLFLNHKEHRSYGGSIPYGIDRFCDQTKVVSLMSHTGLHYRSWVRDTWVDDNWRMTVDYSSEDEVVSYIVFLAPPKPHRGRSLDLPTPDRFHACLGKNLRDKDVISLIDEMGADYRVVDLEDNAEIDLLEENGLYFGFSDFGNEVVLDSVLFAGDGRYGAAIWAGELPGALDFEMDFREVIEAAKRQPDDIVETDFALSAYWKSGNKAMIVEYSTMENKILAVEMRFRPS